ncbi:TetR/AcrR family transcriptional regulator [Longispora urticae]
MTSSTAERIASAARGILHAEGADAVTMRRVADAVGITPMAIYRHFPDRQALLRAVADAAFADAARDWGSTPLTGDLRADLRVLVDEHLDFALGHPRLYAFMFTDRREEARQFSAGIREGGSPTLNLLVAFLRAQIAAGGLRDDDVWEVALTLAAHLHGLVLLHQGDRTGLSDEDFRGLAHRSVERLVRGLAA